MKLVAIDTNIFVYAVSAGRRRARAIEILLMCAAAGAVVPVQVFGEFTNVCRKKALMSACEVTKRVEEWAPAFETPETEVPHISAAAILAEARSVQFFDALIVHVAMGSGATVLLSEDMADGESYDGVRVLNPFNPANAAEIDALLTASS